MEEATSTARTSCSSFDPGSRHRVNVKITYTATAQCYGEVFEGDPIICAGGEGRDARRIAESHEGEEGLVRRNVLRQLALRGAQALTAGKLSFRRNPPLRRCDGEEAPLTGHALELVSAATLELEP